jgi:hypothetical protein
MQPHDQHDPPERPDPKGSQAKCLLLAICILLGVIVSQVVKRFP